MSGAAADLRPVVLVPPSKGKAEGGDGPAYREVVDDGPLGAPRRRVLDALADVAKEVDDATLARIAGITNRDVAATRRDLAALDGAPTLPARARYTGVVHGNAGLAGMSPWATDVEVLVLSALLGVAALEDPVPAYRLELAASLPPLGGLATFWRDAMGSHLMARLAGRQVLDLLPAAHARALAPAVREGAEVIRISFETPTGRAANAARTKVAKGRVVAQLAGVDRVGPGHRTPDAAQPAGAAAAIQRAGVPAATRRGGAGDNGQVDLTPIQLAAWLDPGEGWQLAVRDAHTLVATYRG